MARAFVPWCWPKGTRLWGRECVCLSTYIFKSDRNFIVLFKFNEIPFFGILVKRCPNNTFVTSFYRKKTFTGLYTKWDSFTPRKYKINLIRTLTYRCYRICNSASLLQSTLDDLRRLLLKNVYPHGIITYNVNDVLNRNRNKPNSPVSTVPKKDIIILLPYLGLRRATKSLNTLNHVYTISTLLSS